LLEEGPEEGIATAIGLKKIIAQSDHISSQILFLFFTFYPGKTPIMAEGVRL